MPVVETILTILSLIPIPRNPIADTLEFRENLFPNHVDGKNRKRTIFSDNCAPCPGIRNMSNSTFNIDGRLAAIIQRAIEGDRESQTELFEHFSNPLRRMVRLRLDSRLQSRFDEKDVLQEAFLDFSRRIKEYKLHSELPFFVWLRALVLQRLVDFHRHHLGTQKRNPALEVSIYRGGMPMASSALLAEQLMGKFTSASQAAMRAEIQLKVQGALNELEEMDREVLTLRHFEQLNNAETAQILGIKPTAASNRYTRALIRLKQQLSQISGLGDFLR
jgi:RNA polymerase sigma-70 factor (ECF subfamily)